MLSKKVRKANSRQSRESFQQPMIAKAKPLFKFKASMH